MGFFNKTTQSATTATSNHLQNGPMDGDKWATTTGNVTTGNQDWYTYPTPYDVEVLANAINVLEAKVEELQAKLEGMKECPKCMRFTPHWDDDDHYLCNDCR